MINTTLKPHIPDVEIQWNPWIKSLGVIFFQTHNITRDTNWYNLIDKVKRKLNLVKYRNLSYRGKIHILNSKLLSKVWNLSTLYEIPKLVSKTLNRYISSFIWGESTPDLVKKDIILMHKMKGGLGLLDHQSQNQALRLRFIHKILDQNVDKKWTYFARYWISVKLSNICNEWASLHRRDRPMNTRDNLVPEHYKQILTLTTQHLQNILKDKHKTTKTTYTLIREHKEKTHK